MVKLITPLVFFWIGGMIDGCFGQLTLGVVLCSSSYLGPARSGDIIPGLNAGVCMDAGVKSMLAKDVEVVCVEL